MTFGLVAAMLMDQNRFGSAFPPHVFVWASITLFITFDSGRRYQVDRPHSPVHELPTARTGWASHASSLPQSAKLPKGMIMVWQPLFGSHML